MKRKGGKNSSSFDDGDDDNEAEDDVEETTESIKSNGDPDKGDKTPEESSVDGDHTFKETVQPSPTDSDVDASRTGRTENSVPATTECTEKTDGDDVPELFPMPDDSEAQEVGESEFNGEEKPRVDTSSTDESPSSCEEAGQGFSESTAKGNETQPTSSDKPWNDASDEETHEDFSALCQVQSASSMFDKKEEEQNSPSPTDVNDFDAHPHTQISDEDNVEDVVADATVWEDGLIGDTDERRRGASRQVSITVQHAAQQPESKPPFGNESCNTFASEPKSYAASGNESCNTFASGPKSYAASGNESCNTFASVPKSYAASGNESCNTFASGLKSYAASDQLSDDTDDDDDGGDDEAYLRVEGLESSMNTFPAKYADQDASSDDESSSDDERPEVGKRLSTGRKLSRDSTLEDNKLSTGPEWSQQIPSQPERNQERKDALRSPAEPNEISTEEPLSQFSQAKHRPRWSRVDSDISDPDEPDPGSTFIDQQGGKQEAFEAFLPDSKPSMPIRNASTQMLDTQYDRDPRDMDADTLPSKPGRRASVSNDVSSCKAETG